jgi:sugar phosphate permease
MASAIPFISRDLQLSPMAMGEVLSAFFVGYALMQTPGGMLADRFGPRSTLTFSILWFSGMTALTGLSPGLSSILVTRVLFGLGEGPFPPGVSRAIANWFPPSELGTANGIQLGAAGLGATLAPVLVVSLIIRWGWRTFFFAFCLPGVVLALLVWVYVRNSPRESPRVGTQELLEYKDNSFRPTPLILSLTYSLRSSAVAWCAATLFLANVMMWGLYNWLPTYLLEARGFAVERMGIFAAVTNFAGALGCPLGGYLCDKYFSRRLSVLVVAGLLISAVFTYLAAIASNGEWAVAYLTVVFIVANIAGTAIFTLPLIIVPTQAVGGAFGVVNTAGQLAGVVSPLLIGHLLERTHNNFQIALYVLVGITCLAIYPAARIKQPITDRKNDVSHHE